MGAIRNTRRYASELKDKFRKRQTEKPRKVGYYKKAHVLIGNSRQTETGLEADFIQPRLGTPLAPYNDHIYAPALAIAGQQMAIYLLKSSVNTKTHEILLTEVGGFKFRRKIPFEAKVVLRLRKQDLQMISENATLQSFEIKGFVKGEKNPFGHGNFKVAIVPKTK